MGVRAAAADTGGSSLKIQASESRRPGAPGVARQGRGKRSRAATPKKTCARPDLRAKDLPIPTSCACCSRGISRYVPAGRQRVPVRQGAPRCHGARASRLTGGGPFVVIAHSQGSMIAYEVLRRSTGVASTFAVRHDRFAARAQGVQDQLGNGPAAAPAVPSLRQTWVNVRTRSIRSLSTTLSGRLRGGPAALSSSSGLPSAAPPHSVPAISLSDFVPGCPAVVAHANSSSASARSPSPAISVGHG